MATIKHTLRFATCLTLMSISAPAYANNLFLLQLGLFTSEEAANSQFSQVMETHGKLLDGMRYISKKSQSISGGDVTWRSLVGPYENRKLASRACSELKESGQDCFVVETAAINLEEVEAGTELAAKDVKKEDAPKAATTNESEAKTEEFAPESTSDSAWDWLGGSSKNDESDDDSEQAAEEKTASNSNININTHSVYSKKEEPRAEVQIGLADSLSNLFGGSDTEDDADSDTSDESVTSAAPDESEQADKSESNINSESKAAATRSGEVEIAEAIPVPLTEPEDVPVTQSAPVEPEPADGADADEEEEEAPAIAVETPKAEATEAEMKQPEISAIPAEENPSFASAPIRSAPKRIPLTEYRRENASSRMLQVSVFENDRLAFRCLNTLHGSMPAASMLRSRIIKSTTGQAVLRLGPVNDAELEAAICTTAVQCGEEVQCRIIAERETRKPLRLRDTGAKLLPARSRDRHAPMPRNLSPIPSSKPQAAANGPVWVQLGTSSSEADAKSKFETLQRLYPELLKDYQPTINTPENQSVSGGRVYRLRVGSFDDRSKAQSLCSALSSRGIGCLVLSK